jgi:hypothetical protein
MFARPTQTQPNPHSYYLKVWQVRENESPVWKALLVSIDSNESFSFPNLETLYAFLNGTSVRHMLGDENRRMDAMTA